MNYGTTVAEREKWRRKIRKKAAEDALRQHMTIRCQTASRYQDGPAADLQHAQCVAEDPKVATGCLCTCHDRRARAGVVA